jgi:predicted RNase H-like HicB family nuclease
MERFRLPVDISELPNGDFVATCLMVEGCHAEGRTVGEAVDHMEEIAKAIVDMKSPYAVLAHPHSTPPKAKRRCPVF